MFGRTNHGWIGLDIGASTIKLAQVARSADRLRLEEAVVVYRREPWRETTLAGDPPISAADEVQTAVVSAAQCIGTRTAAVLSPTTCDFNAAPHIESSSSAQVAAIVDELETLGISLVDRVFDFWPGLANRSRQGSVNVVSTSRGWSERTTTDLLNAGLSCQAIDALPHALTRAVNLVHSKRSGPVAALDWGYAGTLFVLIDQGQPTYVRSLRHTQFAEAVGAVASDLDLEPREATELLTTVSLAPRRAADGDTVSQAVGEILQPALNHLVADVQRTLEHLQNVGKNLAPQSVYLFGGGATIGGIGPLLRERLGRQVQVWTLDDQAAEVAADKAAPLCLLGPAIALSALKWEAPE